MFVTTLNFKQILNDFYNSEKYDFLFLFVSNFGNEDKKIIKSLVDNASRIDRITGKRICMYYFAKRISYVDNHVARIKWVRDEDFSDTSIDAYIDSTMDASDDICRHLRILRSYLPAFIVVSNDRTKPAQVFSVRNYEDFESLLTPLNVLHSYLQDREFLLSYYNGEIKLSPAQIKRYDEVRRTLNATISLLQRKMQREIAMGMIEKAEKREIQLKYYKQKLECVLNTGLQGEHDPDSLLVKELDSIKKFSISRLNVALASYDGEEIIEMMQDSNNYSTALLKVWDLVVTKSSRISRALKNIRYHISESGYDVFISCKSEDYKSAKDLYCFLIDNGYKPFLADVSIKEAGIDIYTSLIGEVLDVCNNMIVFTTNIDYLSTSYVSAEWNSFVNDINTGKKANGRLINVLSQDIDLHQLPNWLRDKQCLRFDDYKDTLLNFLV